MQAFEVERPTAVERRKLKPVSWIIAALLCAAFLAGLIGFCSRNGGNSASKVGSCKPGDVDSYAGIIHKDKGGWCLNNVCGDYRFDLNSGWLFGGEEKVGQFSCQRLQSDMLNLTSDAVWKLRDYFHILSSEIMTEIQKEENAGALFVVPAQLNGAEYPSATRVVHHVADYKEDIRGGPRGQLAAHPAVAQFLLDNAQSVERPKGINAADQIVDLPGFEVVNGYMKIQKTDKVKETLQDLKRRLNSLRLLVMEHVSTQGLVPKLSGFAKTSHRVGLVYASTIPVDSYVNGRTGESDPTDHEYQTQVAELMLVAQYYGALKYAAETTQKIVELTPRHRPRKVFLMPLGGGSFQNPWEIIGRSMAKAIQMLDHELLVTLEISALAFNQKPSEKEKLQSILEKLHSKVQIDERCIESGGSNHMVGAFRPTCQSDGSFAPQQCWGSTGFCWCSDKVGHEFRETRGREEVEGVFSFPCFSQEFVKLFNAEIENFYASKIPARRPNSMNNYGVIVNEIGMRPMITQFQQEYIWPIAKALFPDEASQFDSHHSFIVRYTATEDLGLDMHTDDSDITFNVCLGFEFTGATLTFCGYMGAADHRKASHVYHHEVGRAVLHLGSRRHGADNIESGTRMNLIVWSHNKAWRRAHPSRLRREYYAKEDGPPDEVCLSYTHDRDYLAYKKAPKGRAGGRNRPWCPPEGKEYENFPDSDTSM